MHTPTETKQFRDDEDGAVTVDWVVLTAALVTLGTGVVSIYGPGITSASSQIENQITSSYTQGLGSE